MQEAFNEICVGDGDCGVREGALLNPLILEREPAGSTPEAPAADGAAARVITIEDVARFLPAAVALHAEPDGWAVIGVPANFWTVVRPVEVEAALLGEQASVRFTPQLYRWVYGDGSSRTTRSGGASWAGSGQEELTATPTSHVYRERAAADASVTVVWSAEYRFADGDWTPIAGAVADSSPAVRMLVVRERTVLTAR